ncbi:unnamed protein product [Phytophthora fragariaefolia]|uniref:Unnamed protein product n=1 Tax=Phytophthora fragariaefolia TaxID=1490495 RepID=A0A9W6YMX3_9STRA|nr:unnamed protein product [Phytophthora fragariaefolia]
MLISSSTSRPLTASYESVEAVVSGPRSAAALSPEEYVVKVRVLHGIDLYIPNTKNSSQQAGYPVVHVGVNGSPLQSSTAARHARNHSIWKKHELKFRVRAMFEGPPNADKMDAPSCIVSMYVSLSYTACPCASNESEKIPNSLPIGEVGELQLPVKGNEAYEILRFFPVIRRQHQSSQSGHVLFPAGKLKLWIRIEKSTATTCSTVVETPKRPPFALPTNFGEALQMKRKQLRATVIPEDNSQNMNNHHASQVDSNTAVELLTEIATETAPDHISVSDLKVGGQIGEGIHSCVMRGTLRWGSDDSTRQVAVKEFRHQHAVPPVRVLRAFQQEYRALVRCRNQKGDQHIVELLGVTLEPRLIVLMEYFSHGR